MPATMPAPAITLVTGATGTQGMAVVQTLQRQGYPVRALVRHPDAPAARFLVESGAEIVSGSFEDAPRLGAAMQDVQAVFSVQPAPTTNRDSERQQVQALVAAARAAGVRQIVHSSVSGAGSFETMMGWADGRWARNYWESKRDAEDIVRRAGFPACTILRPGFMMENFIRPKAGNMFPDLVRGELFTAIAPDTRMVLVAAGDIARTAAAAIAAPEHFSGKTLELAGDLRTMPQIAAVLTESWGSPVVARTLSPAALVARGQHAGWVETQEWMNVVNYPARPTTMQEIGVAPTGFRQWADAHRPATGISLESRGG